MEDQGLLTDRAIDTWKCCIGKVAEKLQELAHEVIVSSTCRVDKTSGLLQYPIEGDIVFKQSVSCRIHDHWSSFCNQCRSHRVGSSYPVVCKATWCISPREHFGPFYMHSNISPWKVAEKWPEFTRFLLHSRPWNHTSLVLYFATWRIIRLIPCTIAAASPDM